jgi:ABC-2 type transport system ATP-binding protein
MEEAERLCDRVAVVDHGRIIALGTPRELIAMLGAEHVVEFAVEGDGPTFEPDELLALPGVTKAGRTDGSYQLDVSRLHHAIPALLSFLAARTVTLSAIETHTATLEDVFVHLTGRQLRDA